jgi:hypothetical protein
LISLATAKEKVWESLEKFGKAWNFLGISLENFGNPWKSLAPPPSLRAKRGDPAIERPADRVRGARDIRRRVRLAISRRHDLWIATLRSR